ncbi:MAG: hypothetical protein ABR887_01425 [Methanoregulaceae archaeon]|jgi:hypothetical protein
MQKQDLLSFVLALVVVLAIAFVIKPIATGQPINIGIPENPTITPLPTTQIITIAPTLPTSLATVVPVTTTTTFTPTPSPTWNGSSPQKIQFVNPSNYGLNLSNYNATIPNLPYDSASIRANLTKYATFSGQYSGTTQIVNIPFPYWELWYTVEPMTSDIKAQSTSGTAYVVTPTLGQGPSLSGFQGSYSTALPTLTIQVIDANDTSKIVREISPQGGIDPTLWTTDLTSKTGVTVKATDPRPWKERFYAGYHSYYFVIRASILKSYKIDIMIPSAYIGKI